jgi:hypothetical protein
VITRNPYQLSGPKGNKFESAVSIRARHSEHIGRLRRTASSR